MCQCVDHEFEYENCPDQAVADVCGWLEHFLDTNQQLGNLDMDALRLALPRMKAAPYMLSSLHHILNIEGACFAADDSWNLDWHWDRVRAAIAKAESYTH